MLTNIVRGGLGPRFRWRHRRPPSQPAVISGRGLSLCLSFILTVLAFEMKSGKKLKRWNTEDWSGLPFCFECKMVSENGEHGVCCWKRRQWCFEPELGVCLIHSTPFGFPSTFFRGSLFSPFPVFLCFENCSWKYRLTRNIKNTKWGGKCKFNTMGLK